MMFKDERLYQCLYNKVTPACLCSPDTMNIKLYSTGLLLNNCNVVY